MAAAIRGVRAAALLLGDILYILMKLKEYIDILSKYDQDVEVLTRSKKRHNTKVLVEITKYDIIPPHQHFKYDEHTGIQTLVDSIVV